MAEPYEAENRQIDKRPGARETGNAFDLLRMAEQQTPVSFHEQRMHHLLDQAAPDDQIFIAVHQLNSCPDAVVNVGVSAPCTSNEKVLSVIVVPAVARTTKV